VQQSWESIQNHYSGASSYTSEYQDLHQAMSELCAWIKNSDLKASLFGRTSHHLLLISQVEFEDTIHHSVQTLNVSPNFENRSIEFEFCDTHLENKKWKRTEPPNGETLINRLIGFARQVGWY